MYTGTVIAIIVIIYLLLKDPTTFDKLKQRFTPSSLRQKSKLRLRHPKQAPQSPYNSLDDNPIFGTNLWHVQPMQLLTFECSKQPPLSVCYDLNEAAQIAHNKSQKPTSYPSIIELDERKHIVDKALIGAKIGKSIDVGLYLIVPTALQKALYAKKNNRHTQTYQTRRKHQRLNNTNREKTPLQQTQKPKKSWEERQKEAHDRRKKYQQEQQERMKKSKPPARKPTPKNDWAQRKNNVQRRKKQRNHFLNSLKHPHKKNLHALETFDQNLQQQHSQQRKSHYLNEPHPTMVPKPTKTNAPTLYTKEGAPQTPHQHGKIEKEGNVPSGTKRTPKGNRLYGKGHRKQQSSKIATILTNGASAIGRELWCQKDSMKEIIIDVVKEVPKKVVKYVPQEVTKLVPKEVVKTIKKEVVKPTFGSNCIAFVNCLGDFSPIGWASRSADHAMHGEPLIYKNIRFASLSDFQSDYAKMFGAKAIEYEQKIVTEMVEQTTTKLVPKTTTEIVKKTFQKKEMVKVMAVETTKTMANTALKSAGFSLLIDASCDVVSCAVNHEYADQGRQHTAKQPRELSFKEKLGKRLQHYINGDKPVKALGSAFAVAYVGTSLKKHVIEFVKDVTQESSTWIAKGVPYAAGFATIVGIGWVGSQVSQTTWQKGKRLLGFVKKVKTVKQKAKHIAHEIDDNMQPYQATGLKINRSSANRG